MTAYWSALALLTLGLLFFVPSLALESWRRVDEHRERYQSRSSMIRARIAVVAQALLVMAVLGSYLYLVACGPLARFVANMGEH